MSARPAMDFGREMNNLNKKQYSRHELNLKPIGVENGPARFPESGGTSTPGVSSLKNNLTALSQRRNLLFVAYRHQIYVWEPAGSLQALGSKPEMIITPTLREPDAPGFIDEVFPHNINNVLVDDLGRDEILLLATDSGNVCAYYVESIFLALERAKLGDEPRPANGSHIEPFFSEFVDMSAWGLAIHKFARLIAVSANTGVITVFAFALVDSTCYSSDRSNTSEDLLDNYRCYRHNWLNINDSARFSKFRRLMPDRYRSRNTRLTYIGHHQHIPSVSFLNCELDPNGTWMVSTDIKNRVFIWRIWESLSPVNALDFNKSQPTPHFHGDSDLGWSVLALDPRSFRPYENLFEVCSAPCERKMKTGELFIDLTRLRDNVPDASHRYNYFLPRHRSNPEEPTIPDIFDDDCCISKCDQSLMRLISGHQDAVPSDSVSGADRATSVPVDSFDHHGAEQAHTLVLNDQSAADVDLNTDTDSDPYDSEALPLPAFPVLDDFPGQLPDSVYSEMLLDISSNDSDIAPVHAIDQSESDDSVGMSEDLPSTPKPLCFNFPILHFSQWDVRLIPYPLAQSHSAICSAPLSQTFALDVSTNIVYERLNMVKYIPEHGLVVAATQRGRAAIISLAEVPSKGRVFRINWIVPLQSQEKYGERPLVPLLGMAVGPVQGYEMAPDVPFIPQEPCDVKDVSFRYRLLPSSGEGSDTENDSNSTGGLRTSGTDDQQQQPTSKTQTQTQAGATGRLSKFTLPECHAIANRSYEPFERWRGWSPSRRYRLFLTFANHTVMSYEFWYERSSSVVKQTGGTDQEDLLVI
ncbi:CRT10 domain containing protein [Elaphomyces granulatus]